MTDDISQRTMGFMVIGLVAFSLLAVSVIVKAGPSSRVTALVSTVQNGTATLNIEEVVSILIVNTAIDFGSGFVNDAVSYTCVMDSQGNATNACAHEWASPLDSGFTIQNDGNIDAVITIKGSPADLFIKGTSPSYKFSSIDKSGSQGESGSCNGSIGWTEVDGSEQTLCNQLNFEDAQDMMVVDLEVTIPSDVPPGQHNDTLTFTAGKYSP